MSKQQALALIEEIEDLKMLDLTDQRKLELGVRLQSILPIPFKNPQNAVGFVFYCRSINANPFRQEVYGWEDRDGKLQVTDSYKSTVRWAQGLASYTEWFENIDPETINIDPAALVSKCFILRDDRLTALERLSAIYNKERALEMTASSALGIVTIDEMRYDKGRGNPRKPPKGWDWRQVANKRALRNAIRLSHGHASTRELQESAWMVGDYETVEADWVDATLDAPAWQREQEALLSAEARDSQKRVADMSPAEQEELLQWGREILRGDPDLDLTADRNSKTESSVKPFPSMGAAVAWGFDQGVFEAEAHALSAYKKLKEERQPTTAEEMGELWRADVAERMKSEMGA
jgi:hypothetical protein